MTERDSMPFIRWRDVPLAILFLPFAILFGIHVAGIAMLMRKWTRVPYLLAMVLLYALLLIPCWIPGPSFHFWPSLLGSAATMVCLILPISIRGREEIMDGTNFEASAQAHIMLVLTYLVIPAVHAAITARGG